MTWLNCGHTRATSSLFPKWDDHNAKQNRSNITHRYQTNKYEKKKALRLGTAKQNTHWATSRETLPWGFATRKDTNRLAQLQKLASLGMSDKSSKASILSRQRTTKALIRLRGCASWSAPLLFAYGINRFSHDVAQMYTCRCELVPREQDSYIMVYTSIIVWCSVSFSTRPLTELIYCPLRITQGYNSTLLF